MGKLFPNDLFLSSILKVSYLFSYTANIIIRILYLKPLQKYKVYFKHSQITPAAPTPSNILNSKLKKELLITKHNGLTNMVGILVLILEKKTECIIHNCEKKNTIWDGHNMLFSN